MKKSSKSNVMERERLTITLRKDIISRLDKHIDGAKLRNRSHAIEYLLTKAMNPTIQKALILTGGEGRKLRPITYEIPVGLIPIHGKPLLENTIKTLSFYNIKDITLSVGHLGQKIVDYFGDGKRWGVQITYLKQTDNKGTTAPVRQFLKQYQSSPFLLIYGDVLFDMNLEDFIQTHAEQNSPATVAVTSTNNPSNFGVVSLHGKQVVEFFEKPSQKNVHSYLISAGIYILEPKSITPYIPKKGGTMLEKDTFPQLASHGLLTGYPFEGKWFDISSTQIYEKALREWGKSS